MSDPLFKKFDREYDLSLFYWINKHALKKDDPLTVSDDPINQLIDAVEAVIELARYYFADDDKKHSSIVAIKDDPFDPHKAEIQELGADQFMSDIKKCFPALTIDREILDAKLQNNRCSGLEEKTLLQSVLFINQAANEAMRGRKIGVRKESNFIRPGTKLMRPVTFQQIFDSFLHYQGPLSAGRTCLGISKESGLN
jgi:hypothetical protein